MKLKELIGVSFAEGLKGIGSCGFEWNSKGFCGYLYATFGYGNMERYYTVDELLESYPEMAEIIVSVELNEKGEITYLHG